MDLQMKADQRSMDTLGQASSDLLKAMWREHPEIMRVRTGKAFLDVGPV